MDKKEGFGVYEWVGKQFYKGQFKDDFREGFGRLYQTNKHYPADISDGSPVLDEKLIYSGMWHRGKQKPDIPIDEDAAKQLDNFIS